MAKNIEMKPISFQKTELKNLPERAKQVELYMIPGDNIIYVIEKETKYPGCIIGGDLNISLT